MFGELLLAAQNTMSLWEENEVVLISDSSCLHLTHIYNRYNLRIPRLPSTPPPPLHPQPPSLPHSQRFPFKKTLKSMWLSHSIVVFSREGGQFYKLLWMGRSSISCTTIWMTCIRWHSFSFKPLPYHTEKPIRAPPRLPAVSPRWPSKERQCWSGSTQISDLSRLGGWNVGGWNVVHFLCPLLFPSDQQCRDALTCPCKTNSAVMPWPVLVRTTVP